MAKLQRNLAGIDINHQYVAMAQKRIAVLDYGGCKNLVPQNAKKDSPSPDRFFLLDEIFNNGPAFEEVVEELIALISLR